MKIAGRDSGRGKTAVVPLWTRNEPQLAGEVLSGSEQNSLSKRDSNCRDSIRSGLVAGGDLGLQRSQTHERNALQCKIGARRPRSAFAGDEHVDADTGPHELAGRRCARDRDLDHSSAICESRPGSALRETEMRRADVASGRNPGECA